MAAAALTSASACCTRGAAPDGPRSPVLARIEPDPLALAPAMPTGDLDALVQCVAQCPLAAAVFDRDMRYIAVNRPFAGSFGLTPGEAAGLCHYDVLPDVPEAHRRHNQGCLDGRGVVTRPLELFRREDGQMLWLRYELRPWTFGQGAIGGMVAVSTIRPLGRLMQAGHAGAILDPEAIRGVMRYVRRRRVDDLAG